MSPFNNGCEAVAAIEHYHKLRYGKETRRLPTDFVFLRHDQGDNHQKLPPLSEQRVWQIIQELAERAGIKRNLHPHNWRHRTAQGMYDRTNDLSTVQTLLGHESIECQGQNRLSGIGEMKSLRETLDDAPLPRPSVPQHSFRRRII